MEEIIFLKNVCYSYYGKIPALNNITLSIKRGELFAFIGQNGCGKSTLLNIISGLIFPDSGSYSYNNDIINEKKLHDKNFNHQFRKRIGYIFQNPEFQLFCPTVLDELLFAPLQLNISQEEAIDRAYKVLAMLKIEYLKERPVYMLSGGEKKKVAIASVLTMNPEVLLIDEPLSGLDPKTQTFCTELFLELNNAGKTIIFTTHNLELIDHLQPRVSVISENHTIEKTCPAAEILSDESFLISINLIHEHLHRHDGEVHKHNHTHYIFHKHQ